MQPGSADFGARAHDPAVIGLPMAKGWPMAGTAHPREAPASRSPARAISVAVAACLASLALAQGFAAERAPAAQPSDCRNDKCWGKLVVKKRGLGKWRSQQTFYAYNEQVFAKFTVRGRQVHLVKSWGRGSCQTLFRNRRLRLRIRAKACRSASPIHAWARGPGLKARSGRKLVIKVAYTAMPYQSGDNPNAGDDGLLGFTALGSLLKL